MLFPGACLYFGIKHVVCSLEQSSEKTHDTHTRTQNYLRHTTGNGAAGRPFSLTVATAIRREIKGLERLGWGEGRRGEGFNEGLRAGRRKHCLPFGFGLVLQSGSIRQHMRSALNIDDGHTDTPDGQRGQARDVCPLHGVARGGWRESEVSRFKAVPSSIKEGG